ncbi:hypothetical protein K443DRAFT_675683 [Laccaria amethystina LaAM-08-1]|uniref:AAA+ ATPase domain-containing protein n=1 Tax=Laccaria amethystina LaAM-08-1 TaxID=1095629 RepID=A0A0C9WY18_9AGAR|nr:hypothetical protein K443DRAFT_675683 [Laccaria amethystina LaAM-08-1]
MTRDGKLNILRFPGVNVSPLEKTPMVSNLVFVPLARSLGGLPGILVDQIQFGAFELSFNQHQFLVFVAEFPLGFGTSTQVYILHQGPEDAIRTLLIAAGGWSDQLHDEIWVYNQGLWKKDHGLWVDIQKADWKDIILREEFKNALKKDVYGFFSSRAIYKELAIPWKRGLILYGPPGNGKTISIKAIMKTCGEQGYAPLYVKSFQSWQGEEAAMAEVFNKARQLSPCVMILEDLDSLINDKNRSFFLNQLDGIVGNDGLLVIGTTNHFNRLDPGLSSRPSRFDRKFKFDDPDWDERILYARYWQKKLLPNKAIDYPDRLVKEIADLTNRFSFAYLKEAFVSTLVTLAGLEGDKPSFESILKVQIETLKKQLDQADVRPTSFEATCSFENSVSPSLRVPCPDSSQQRDVRVLLDTLSDHPPRIYDLGTHGRDLQTLHDALLNALAKCGLQSPRLSDTDFSPEVESRMGNTDVGAYRALLDRVAYQRNGDI